MRRYATPLSDIALYHKSPRGRAPSGITIVRKENEKAEPCGPACGID
jgi:hypothetical protein